MKMAGGLLGRRFPMSDKKVECKGLVFRCSKNVYFTGGVFCSSVKMRL